MNRMIIEQTSVVVFDSEVFYKYLLEKKEIENQFRSLDVGGCDDVFIYLNFINLFIHVWKEVQ